MTNNEIKEAIFTNVTAIDLTLENTDMTVSETTNFEIGNLADVNAYDPENQVSASISQAMSVPTEDDTSDDKETKSGLAVKATDAATGTDITDIVDKYVSVSIEGTKLVVKYTDEKYETNIDLTVTLNTNGNAAANEFSSPITIHIN
ncbi:hypothetical protein Zmor_008915 [Zophobas morio]|uniref:Uncharacterized protein n=1 Tax=Zophobas morio TaxID=2755281 RepID=A0AA38HIJ0_9CUCU|nr:hypothetical protein Zmor_008915 [Zophobas morio]